MKGKFFLALKTVISLGLVSYFYSQVDLFSVIEVLRSIDPIYYVLGFLLNYLGGISTQSMITKLSSNDIKISLFKMDNINLGMRFYSIILPMAAVSVIRWQRYTVLGCSKLHALGIMVLNKSLQYLFIFLFLFMGLLVFEDIMLSKMNVSSYRMLLLLVGSGSIFFVILSLGCMKKIKLTYLFDNLLMLCRYLPFQLSIKGREIVKRIKEYTLKDIIIDNARLYKIFFLSSLGILLVVSSQYYLALSIGVKIGFLSIFFVRAFVQLLVMLPISVGGVGLREVGFVSTLSLFNIAAENALALALMLFSIQIIFGMLGAVLELIYVFKKSSIQVLK